MSRINSWSRSRDNSSSSSSPSLYQNKSHRRYRLNDDSVRSQPDRRNPQQGNGKPTSFFSYLELPDLAPNIRILCEIIANSPPSNVEKALEDSLIRVTQKDVEGILKLSYNHASSALKFFRWAGAQLNDEHSPYSWNLLVDLLGRNSLFDAMWDAIKSMRNRGLITLPTFASVFSSYAGADLVREAFRAFTKMDQYGCPRDIMALNSLLSAVCRHGKTAKADEFLSDIKNEIKPDSDSYAILLEGWEKERNVDSARHTFGEMVAEIGFDQSNSPAYDSFLCTMLKGHNGLHKAMKYFNILREKNCTPGHRFFSFALEECVRNKDARGASLLWEAMTMRNAITRPTTGLYNLMICLHCDLHNPDIASRFLDDMVYDGAFPDSLSYNILLRSYIECRNPSGALSVFSEMIKNEFPPSHSNCVAAVRMCLDTGFPLGAVRCWKFMVAEYANELDETANLLIKGLIEHNFVQEAVKYAEDIMKRGISLSSTTVAELEDGLSKAGKRSLFYDIKSRYLNRSVS